MLTIAPLKSRIRCDEKVKNEYGGKYYCIVDCVRCSVVVGTEEELMSVANDLIAAGASDGFILVWLKNRFAKPLFNGYRDGLYNIALRLPGGGVMVCEVQLHLAAVLSHKEVSHHYYEYFRKYFAGNNKVVAERMEGVALVGHATSPDALLHGALEGEDEARLAALDELIGDKGLGDYSLWVTVRRGRLKLLLSKEASAELVIGAKLDLGEALRKAHQYEEAEPLFREVLEGRRKVLGVEHPDTLGSMNKLANLLSKTERMDEAELLYREVLEVRRKVLGVEHPDTLRSMLNLAHLFSQTERKDEAEPLYREVIGTSIRRFPPPH